MLDTKSLVNDIRVKLQEVLTYPPMPDDPDEIVYTAFADLFDSGKMDVIVELAKLVGNAENESLDPVLEQAHSWFQELCKKNKLTQGLPWCSLSSTMTT